MSEAAVGARSKEGEALLLPLQAVGGGRDEAGPGRPEGVPEGEGSAL